MGQSKTEAPARQHPANPAGHACVVAEIGVNHDGSLDRALEMVEVAHQCGADAVKFQTFRADRMTSASAPLAGYQRGGVPSGDTSQLSMLQSLELSPDDFQTLHGACRELEIEFLSTPFDEESVDVVARLGVSRFKIGSGDLTHLPLLRRVAGYGRPVVLSTGMARDEEIGEALDTLDSGGCPEVTLLHCISRYPAPAEDLQLLRIPALRERFERPVGYSDHSLGFEAALGARALGALFIEKHFTLDNALPGPDHAASATPEEFADMIQRLRTLETMLGTGERRFAAEEAELRDVARKSLVATAAIPAGDLLHEGNVGLLRPGTGIEPSHYEEVLGRRAIRDIPEGTPVEWSALQ